MTMRIGAPTVWAMATAFSAVDARRRLPRLVLEWAPFIGVLMVYDLLRGRADGLLFSAHETPQIHAEAAIFGKPVPTVWLQSHLWHGAAGLRWWDYVTWFIYLTHFLATPILAAVLWTFFHDRFARYATMVCTLALAAFATYALYPAVPPWMAAQDGNLGESNRTVPVVWAHIPVDHFNALFAHGVQYANNVAAVPSLHAAFALLVTLYLWRLAPRWARVPLALYPLAMTFALVYSGEHYGSTAFLAGSTPELHSGP